MQIPRDVQTEYWPHYFVSIALFVELKGLAKTDNNNPTPFLLIIYDSHYDIIVPIHEK